MKPAIGMLSPAKTSQISAPRVSPGQESALRELAWFVGKDAKRFVSC